MNRLKNNFILQDISKVALLLGLLPPVIININYLIAATEGHVPWCVPYWESCTSISATGRGGTAFVFFKLTMIPVAFVYLWYWKLANDRLAAAGYSSKLIFNLGVIACIALIAYTLALGAIDDSFRLTRRLGIILYFTLTYLNQLLILYQLYKRKIQDPSRQLQLLLCLLILCVGILTLYLDALVDNYDDYEDAFEWNLALLLHLNFLCAWWGWRELTHPRVIRKKEAS